MGLRYPAYIVKKPGLTKYPLLSIDNTLRSIPGYLVSWPLQETSGAVAVADNVAVALGRELFVKDFTAGLWAAAAATIDDLDSFTSPTGGGVRADDSSISVGKTYVMRVKGTTSAPQITIVNHSNTAHYKTITGSGAFDESFSFTASTANGIYIRNSNTGTTDIDWANTTIKQTNILASSAYTTPGDNPLDGAHTGVSVGQAGQYKIPVMAEYDGALSQTNKTSAEYNSSYTPDEFTRAIVMRKTTWDATERWIFQDWVDANSFIGIRDSTTVGTIEFVYKQGGTEYVVPWVSGSPTNSKLLDLSVSGGVMEGRVNGVSQGTIAIGAAIVGNFAVNMLGAEHDGTNVHLGFLAYDEHYTSKTTDADMVRVANSMGIPS
jgi:hypothetical protein